MNDVRINIYILRETAWLRMGDGACQVARQFVCWKLETSVIAFKIEVKKSKLEVVCGNLIRKSLLYITLTYRFINGRSTYQTSRPAEYSHRLGRYQVEIVDLSIHAYIVILLVYRTGLAIWCADELLYRRLTILINPVKVEAAALQL